MKQPGRTANSSESALALLHARKTARLVQTLGFVQTTLVKARKLRAAIMEVDLDVRDGRFTELRASLSRVASLLEDLHGLGFGPDLDWFGGRARLMSLRLRRINPKDRESALAEIDLVDFELVRLEAALKRRPRPQSYRS